MIDVRSIVKPGGVCDTWLKWGEPFESPDSYLLFALLTAASAAINGRIVVNPDSRPRVKTNIYTILYGPSGSRKSTALDMSLGVLGAAVPEVPILPRSFSMERLLSSLAETSKEKERCGGLIVSDEFSRLIGVRDYMEANLGFLSELYDCPPTWSRDTQTHQYEEILNPYIVINAASSPEWLEGTKPDTLTGGALRRLLIVYEFGPKQENSNPYSDGDLLQKVVDLFCAHVGKHAFGPQFMMLSDAAIAAKDEWYKTVVHTTRMKADSRVGHFASCMPAHALKLAACYHLLEGRPPHLLSEDSMLVGQRLVTAIVPHMLQAYAALVPTPYAKLRSAVFRTVMEMGGKGHGRDIDRKVVFASGVKPISAAEARVHMIEDGTLGFNPETRLIFIPE